MVETYVSIKKVADYAIGVLKYFAVACSILLMSIIGALLAWMFWNAVAMILSIIGMMASTIIITLGMYVLYSQKDKSR